MSSIVMDMVGMFSLAVPATELSVMLSAIVDGGVLGMWIGYAVVLV